MTLPGPMTLLPISGAAALLVAMLIVVSIRRVRANKRVALAQAKETALIDQIEARIDGLAQRLEGHQTLMMNRLHDDIRGLQSDMDWLAGERMIEEAIAMAHAGQQPAAISDELGLSMDAAETITRFRKH
ncbi:hypothetical protein MWN63_03485 [Paradonghicola geojensis]|nr:hypothetical protein [Marivivens geojensis]